MIYSEACRVRMHESSHQGALSLMSLANYLQDAADQHANQLGVGMPDFAVQGLAWALHRMRITVNRWPRIHEQIVVETNPSGLERAYVFRDFRVYDSNGNLLITATSIWLVFNSKSRRLVVHPPQISTAYEPYKHLSVLTKPSFVFRDFPERIFTQTEHSVRHNEIDMNDHVNNGVYFQWLLEPLSEDFLDAHQCEEVEILFKKECTRKDLITSQCVPLENAGFLHRLVTQEGKDIASAFTRWKRSV